MAYHMATEPQRSTLLKSRYHHGDLRRELLRVAREEVARNGAAAVSLASLARRAGVSQPAPYRHFADREALLAEVAVDGFREFSAVLVAAAQPGGAHDAVKRMAQAYVGFAEANLELYRLMFASRIVPEAPPDSALVQAAKASFGLLLEAVAARGGAADPEETARAIWAQVHGLVMLKAEGFIDQPLADIVAKLSL
jgi:AcrR family transcriptional regulator